MIQLIADLRDLKMSGLYVVSAVSVFFLCLSFCSEISANICGTVQDIDSESDETIAKDRNAWPFLAAIFSTESDNFICDGSLISAKCVLTAAHCVQPTKSAEILAPEDLLVLLGAYNLDDMIERGTRQKDVDEIVVHPDWNASSEQHDADVAILRLSGAVEFTVYIRPICMPDADVPENAMGSIVGYALSDRKNMRDPIPLEAHARVSNYSVCIAAQPDTSLPSSQRKFCGVSEVGGNARGGFFVHSDSVWIQFGIPSTATNKAGDSLERPDSYVRYTSVWAFQDWIDKTVTESGYRVFKKKVEIDLECLYSEIYFQVYNCRVPEGNVWNQNFEVRSFFGSHLDGYADPNVTGISLENSEFQYIPDGIGQKFKKLREFHSQFHRGGGFKRLHRSNFKDMDSLNTLNVAGNIIETIDEDTLRDLPNLWSLRFNGNRVKVLHKKTFEKNFKLETVDARNNQLEFLHKDLFKHNPLLQYAEFSDNQLKRILIDFTLLKPTSIIAFRNNICIDKDASRYPGDNMIELQRVLRDQCSEIKEGS